MGATAYEVKMTAAITDESTSHGGRRPSSHRSLAAPSPRRAAAPPACAAATSAPAAIAVKPSTCTPYSGR